MTRDLYSLNMLVTVMVLHSQILLCLAIAEAILTRITVPPFHGIAPRYLKLVTSSHFWPFILISALYIARIRKMSKGKL